MDVSVMRPGLYHVHGRNEAEPELEAGAAGKSTLLDAFHWGCFGRTSRGLRAGAVRNWNLGKADPCLVVLEWETVAGKVGVFRSQGPNALEVISDDKGERPVDQAEVDRLLMPEAVYRHCIHFAQFSETFIDLKPAEQSAIFTDVLALGIWEEAAKRAGHDVAGLEALITECKEDLALVTGQLEELSAADFEKLEVEWNRKRAHDLKGAKGIAASAMADAANYRGRVGEARVGAKVSRETDEKLAAASRAHAACLANTRRAGTELEELKGADYTNCPTCGAPVDSKHIKKEIAAKQKVLEAAYKAETAMADKVDSLAEELQSFGAVEERLREAERMLATAEERIRWADIQVLDIQTATNPYTELRMQADERGNLLVEEMEELEGKVKSFQAQAAVTGYWVKGFKEIRLSLINESLAQLTIEANEVLYQMGLKEWSVEFDVERETKSGTINKNFTVLVHSPHTDQPVPWEAWCGGETQRLRVAISMGFSNLICSRLGVQPNIEMWDEPTMGLPEGGIHSLLQVLADRAERLGKVILLADHHSLDFGGFAGVLTIVKDKEGSRIE